MSKEELKQLKEDVDEIQERLRALTDEELEQVFGGAGEEENSYRSTIVNMT